MKKEFLEVVDFAVHIITGTLMFLIFGASALGVGLFVDWIDTVHYNVVVHYSLKFIEYVIFLVDSVLLLTHVFKTLKKLFRKE